MIARRVLPSLAVAALAPLAAVPARAEVADSSAYGFTVKTTVTVAAPSDAVFLALVDDVGDWWNPEHTYSGASENLTIDPYAGGCFCEQLEGDGSIQHMQVIYVQPGKTLRMVGALGPLQGLGVCGSMTWEFAREDPGSRIEMTYAVGGYGAGGLAKWAGVVDTVLSDQVERLKAYVEGTSEE
jgi:uncharacterized protein YndB with AHSA1/START domain